MNVEMLHYFRYVAKYKNITSAAQHLYISQPTLSRQIMALEDELGVKLFERTHKQMRLTQAGEVFYKDSESFVKHMQTVISNAQIAGKGNTGSLRITLPMTLHDVLHHALTAMREAYPSVQIVLEAYNFDEIPNAVYHGLYDAGLTYDFASFHDENESFKDSIGILPLRKETFSLLVPQRYKGADSNEVMEKAASDLPLILPAHMDPPFLKTSPSRIQRVNTTESAVMNVAAGLGYSLVPSSWRHYYGNKSKEVVFIELSGEAHSQCSVVLLYNKTCLTQTAENFIKLV